MREKFFKSFVDNGVEFQVVFLGIQSSALMQVWVQPNIEAPFEWSVRLFAFFHAESQIFIDRGFEIFLQALHVLPFKASEMPGATARKVAPPEMPRP